MPAVAVGITAEPWMLGRLLTEAVEMIGAKSGLHAVDTIAFDAIVAAQAERMNAQHDAPPRMAAYRFWRNK
jgi:hypothetical protein